MQKRGLAQNLIYGSIISLIVSSIIIMTLMVLVNRVTGLDTTLERNYAARDLALLLDTIYASPGDIEYFYFMPKRFGVTVKDNLVAVRDEKTRLQASHYFATSDEFTEQEFSSDMQPRALRIIKKGGTITTQGVYDAYESEAINSFTEMTQFIKANKDKRYYFRCREEYELKLSKGYYVVIGRDGEAALFLETETRQVELAREKAADFKHLETETRQDFIITPNDWKPSTAITTQFKNRIIIVNDEKTKTWLFAQPTIKTNELQICEAQELARRRS